MQRIEKHFFAKNAAPIKDKILIWANKHPTVAWLDSNKNKSADIDGILAVDSICNIKIDYENAFNQLKTFIDTTKDYAFGYLGYDLKNDLEKINSTNTDQANFPDLFFFQPKKIIEIKQDKIIFKYPTYLENEIENDWIAIQKATHISTSKNKLNIESRIEKSQYINQVKKALQHIHLGQVYELNFCQEFFAKNAVINPLDTYLELNRISSAPFASYLKFDDLYLLSASPERFLKKLGNQLLSEPIKGTAKRNSNITEDQKSIESLKNNTKEIAENIMIVDLVRNDLSRIAKKGTVKVEELCKIHTFKQVHQMISSISCVLKENIHPVDAIKACYPMGSMTGAPKIAAINFIEELERSKRGIYSGAVGYFTPDQNFDFNVVIRSIVYNKPKKYVSFSVGSAITAKAIPEQEYNECLLKAKAMRKVLTK